MGSIENPQPNGTHKVSYSVQEEARSILKSGIFGNLLIAQSLPSETSDYASRIKFIGSPLPSLPINWRFAESASSLKALEACLISTLLKRKYDVSPGSITISTDHAQLFFMSAMLYTIDPDGKHGGPARISDRDQITKWFKDCDLHNAASSLHRSAATNIYRTKDGKYFHLHGSMNPDPSLESIGLPHDSTAKTPEEAVAPFIEKMATINSADMQDNATNVYKQAGTICETVESFRASEHGKLNAHVGLFDIHEQGTGQRACWWPSIPQTSAARPLAGLKVVDLTRIIAAPAVTRGLAELGASVMRVTSSNITDMSSLHCDLSWGKWNCHIDLKTQDGRQQLKALVMEADVVLQGYRPGVLDKYGFGVKDIVEMCKGRERGIISARENCYGWQGPWSNRSGWQQISDACTGVSHSFGKAMGLSDDEAVTPVFPNSDYMTGGKIMVSRIL